MVQLVKRGSVEDILEVYMRIVPRLGILIGAELHVCAPPRWAFVICICCTPCARENPTTSSASHLAH